MIGGSKLKVFAKELEGKLANMYHDYANLKKVYIIPSTELIRKMQLKRILKSENLEEHFEFIKSVADV